jgi:hypothetical protein
MYDWLFNSITEIRAIAPSEYLLWKSKTVLLTANSNRKALQKVMDAIPKLLYFHPAAR